MKKTIIILFILECQFLLFILKVKNSLWKQTENVQTKQELEYL